MPCTGEHVLFAGWQSKIDGVDDVEIRSQLDEVAAATLEERAERLESLIAEVEQALEETSSRATDRQ